MTDSGRDNETWAADDAGRTIGDARQAALIPHVDRPRRLGPVQSRPPALPPGVFDPEDIAILRSAYDEACACFGGDVAPEQRHRIAMAIVRHARRGLRDPRRLASKAIVVV